MACDVFSCFYLFPPEDHFFKNSNGFVAASGLKTTATPIIDEIRINDEKDLRTD